MARRSQHSFLKRQKEMKRKDEAMEKMARRHGKGGPVKDAEDNEQQAPDDTDDKEAGS
jgi:hypothetical protein